MSYLDNVAERLVGLLLGAPEDDETEDQWIERVKKEVKNAILESYRNGQKAGMKEEKPKGEEKPARRPFWSGRKQK